MIIATQNFALSQQTCNLKTLPSAVILAHRHPSNPPPHAAAAAILSLFPNCILMSFQVSHLGTKLDSLRVTVSRRHRL